MHAAFLATGDWKLVTIGIGRWWPLHLQSRLPAALNLHALAHASRYTGTMPAHLQATQPDFLELFVPSAQPVELGSGYTWTEGPVYLPADQALIFSDVRQNKTWRYAGGQMQPELDPSDYQNGHCLDAQGRLVACSHGQRALLRQEISGEWTVLAERFEGQRFNSPNDVCLAPDGSLWFSDPTYGLDNPLEGYGGEAELPGRWVFRLSTQGKLSAPIRDRLQPNGLAFAAPDILLLADTDEREKKVYRYHVEDGKATCQGVHFAVEPGLTDGLRLDEAGRIWSSAGDGVHVISADGKTELGRIILPQICSNLCFGGPQGTTLYMTASGAVWSIETRVRGLAL